MAGLLQGLHVGGVVGVAEDDVEQWPVHRVGDGVRAAAHGFGEHRFGVEQLPGHADVLTSLSGEQPRRLGCVGAVATHQAWCRPFVGHRGEQLAGRIRRVDHQCGPPLEVGSPSPGGQTYIGQARLGVVSQPVAVARRGLGQCGGSARGKGQNPEPRRVGSLGRGRRRRRGRLFDDDVCVGAGEPERTHSRDPGALAALPRDGFVDNPHRNPVPRYMRGWIAEVQVLGDLVMLQGQDYLENPGDAGRCFEMSDVGLGRTDQQRVVGGPISTQHRSGGLNLDRVTERGSGAVGLQVVDVVGHQAGAVEGVVDHPLLGYAVGHGQTARCAVLVDRATADHGSDPVTVADGVLEAFDGDDSATLAADIAVGGGVERLAPAVGCQHPGLREGDHGGRTEQDVGSTGQGEVTFTEEQRLTGLVDGHQRGTARGVDGDRRPLQPQPVADPARAGRA